MLKKFVGAGVFVAVICIVNLGAGCSRSEQQMKVPEIKMITMENVHGVIAVDDDNIWLTGNYGIIYHSSDGGENWIMQNSSENESVLCDGVFLGTSTGWVVGINGTVLHTTDGGSIWTRQDTGTKMHLP